MSNLMKSSSGLRGVVGRELTPLVIQEFIQSFLLWLPNGPIIIGGDTRTSHDAIKLFISGICQLHGRSVIDIGRVPTPTVQQAVRFHGAAGGIAVTASHNPIEWNGIKIINASGSFLSSEEYQEFESIGMKIGSLKLNTWDTIGSSTHDSFAIDRHIERIQASLPVHQLSDSKLKVLVDVNHGAGAIATPKLFDALGMTATFLYSEPDGRFSHSPEPLPENLTELCKQMAEGDYDIGFAQDPDADRLVIVDNEGRFIGEDYSLAFCMDYYLNQYQLEHPNQSAQVVVNLSTSQIIDWLCQKYKARLALTKIGEPNVTAKIKELNAHIGGEGNGGVILPTIGWGRDSLTGIILALLHLENANKTVGEIVAAYPAFTMLRDKIPLKTSKQVANKLLAVQQAFQTYEMNTEDGVKVIIDSQQWVHIRPSNTEPIIRIFAESPTPEGAKIWNDDTANCE